MNFVYSNLLFYEILMKIIPICTNCIKISTFFLCQMCLILINKLLEAIANTTNVQAKTMLKEYLWKHYKDVMVTEYVVENVSSLLVQIHFWPLSNALFKAFSYWDLKDVLIDIHVCSINASINRVKYLDNHNWFVQNHFSFGMTKACNLINETSAS